MASIQERYDSLTPVHQELAEEMINALLILERLEHALDGFLKYVAEHPELDDSLGSRPDPSTN